MYLIIKLAIIFAAISGVLRDEVFDDSGEGNMRVFPNDTIVVNEGDTVDISYVFSEIKKPSDIYLTITTSHRYDARPIRESAVYLMNMNHKTTFLTGDTIKLECVHVFEKGENPDIVTFTYEGIHNRSTVSVVNRLSPLFTHVTNFRGFKISVQVQVLSDGDLMRTTTLEKENCTIYDSGLYSCEGAETNITVIDILTQDAVLPSTGRGYTYLKCTAFAFVDWKDDEWLWSYRGVMSKEGGVTWDVHYAYSNTGFLSLDNSIAKPGEYVCEIRGVRKTVFLKSAPRIEGITYELSSLKCGAIGYPVPLIKWYKDDGPANHTDTFITWREDGRPMANSSSVIVVRGSGKYKCRASNRLGRAVKEITVVDLTIERPNLRDTVISRMSSNIACGITVIIPTLLKRFIM